MLSYTGGTWSTQDWGTWVCTEDASQGLTVFGTEYNSGTCDFFDPTHSGNGGECAQYMDPGVFDPYYTCPSYDRAGTAVTEDDCSCYGSFNGYGSPENCVDYGYYPSNYYDFTSAFFVGSAPAGPKGLINTTIGATPFYTNASTNPLTSSSLSSGQIVGGGFPITSQFGQKERVELYNGIQKMKFKNFLETAHLASEKKECYVVLPQNSLNLDTEGYIWARSLLHTTG